MATLFWVNGISLVQKRLTEFRSRRQLRNSVKMNRMKLSLRRRGHISAETVRKVQEQQHGKSDVRQSCQTAYRSLLERVKE